MALIFWDERMSVNVAEIDLQHQKLIRMMNDLNDAMLKGKGKDILAEIIRGLIIYTETHFRTEEKYFDQFGYPDRYLHKREHAEFIKKVSDFKDKFEQQKVALSIDIMRFLTSWLQDHIKGSDKKYMPYFAKNGIR